MSTDNLDKEINQLYQQRKNKVVAPTVDLNERMQNIKRKFSVPSIVAIFSVGGLVSFGLMAIISHLVNEPPKQESSLQASRQIDVEKIKPELKSDDNVSVKLALPPKPATNPPVLSSPVKLEARNNPAAASDMALNVNVAKVVVLPTLTQPEINVTPTYKVMPEYPAKAILAKQSGAIKLTYQIGMDGKVENIEMLASDVDRELQRSAKQALSKWQYQPDMHSAKRFEVVFEFKLDEG